MRPDDAYPDRYRYRNGHRYRNRNACLDSNADRYSDADPATFSDADSYEFRAPVAHADTQGNTKAAPDATCSADAALKKNWLRG